MSDQHVTQVKSYTDHTYRFVCSCGAKGIRQPDRERVVASAFFHREKKR